MKKITELKTSFGTIPMLIENDYPNFIEFLKNEKYGIYHKILEAFELMITTNNDIKKLLVVAKVEGVTFYTGFNINKNNIELLSETIMPYFEKIEDYESCNRIHKLCMELKKN
jgi:single-stranded DNA-specific DHH superfamily exonuclease